MRRGCCERPSVGRCNGGRLTTISSSESESWTASGVEVTRGSESSKLSEATTAMVREGASRPNYLDMNTAVRGVLVRFTVPARYRYKEPMRGLLEGHHPDDADNEGRFISEKVTHEAYSTCSIDAAQPRICDSAPIRDSCSSNSGFNPLSRDYCIVNNQGASREYSG